MKLFCSYGSRCLMRMVLLMLAVLLPGTMMLGQTTTTLAVLPSSSSTSPLAPKTMVTLTATVTAGSTPVTRGLVTFCDATAPPCPGLAVVGTAQLTSAGTATLRFIPGGGSHNYRAVFAGTTVYTTSTSTPQTATVLPPTTTSIVSSGTVGNYTLTATVVGTGSFIGPTGAVSFIDATNGNSLLRTATLGTATLGQGFANASGSPIAVGTFPVAVAVGDFNGDGIVDLVVADDADNNNLIILRGDGSGGFSPTPESPITVGSHPFGVAVGDFNGDGYADLAVANTVSNTVSILLGNGSGGFPSTTQVTVGTLPYTVATGDFNGDGNADLAVTNFTSNNVSILLGDGNGGFSEALGSPVTVGTHPYGVAVGDFDGDGHADLAVTNQRDNTVSILLGDGQGGFTPAAPVTVGNFPGPVAVEDFDEDGHADLAVVNVTSDNVSILLGNGHGGFSPVTPVTVGNQPNYVVTGDFDGDGIVDLAVANFNADDDVSILLGNGHGGFSSAPGSPVAVGTGPYAVALGDFNGDGIADLAVPNYLSNNLSVLLNQVTQTATAMVTGVSVPGSGTTHDVNATYAGDTNFDSSTSPTIPLTTSPVATTTLLELSTAGTIPFGTPVTLTANITPYSINGLTATGTMSFFDGATLLATVPISNTGEASTTVSTFTVATHTLTAVYSGNANFVTSTGGPVSLIVNPAPIAVSLTSSDNPSGYGQAVTFAATVPSGATGTIQFRDSSADLGGPVALAGGVAAYATSALAAGTHSITAAYSGDSTHAAATSDVLLQLVTPAILTVTANNVTRTFNQPNGAFNYTITGLIGTDFVRGTPTLVTNATEASPVGTYPIIIGMGSLSSSNYSFMFANGTLTVVPATLTVTANNASRTFGAANPVFTGTVAGAVHGDTFTFSASTTATTSSPVGTYPIIPSVTGSALTNYTVHSVNGTLTVTKATLTVAANNASRVLGLPNPPLTTTITGFVNGDTAAVVSGAAAVSTTATTASPVGTYPITVAQGTLSATNYGFAFVNGILTIDIVILTPPTGPSEEGSPVTLTATVPFGATGTVTFDDGTTVLGTVTIPSSTVGTGVTTVTLVVSTLAPGTHTITAVYSGDANFAPATSPPVTLVVTAAPPDFTVASSTGRQLVPPGASANFTIVVGSMNEPFTNPVTMSASNLPPGATYTFSPAAVTPEAAGANTTFTVSVPPQSSMASRGHRLGPVAFALLLLPFACLKRYRRRPQRRLLWMLVTLASFGAVSGCGEGGYFSQTEQTYTITVTGTSGNLARSTTVTLTVE
jgi:MBG domain (YGX type)/Bacterial Ig-like domain (group 3)/FG-GAP-like repeat